MAKQKTATRQAGKRNGNTGKRYSRPSKNRIGSFLLVIQALVSLVFMGVVFLLDMLPANYLALAAMVLFFLWCLAFMSQALRKKRGVTGKIYSLLLICVLIYGSYHIMETNNMIAKITSGGFKKDMMLVAVLADDPAETLEDAAGYKFGVQFEKDAQNMQTAIADIQEQLGLDIDMEEYASVEEQGESLINGDVQAIIYDSSYTNLLEEAVPDYSSKIRIIYEHEIETALNLGGSGEDDSLITEPFAVYISGIDVYGDERDAAQARESERSDVNIIAVVNPETRQILLVTTPRDYFVPIPGISGGMSDKLTHAGLYGVDASMNTLGALYETDINYYVKVNFTALMEVVDILGGLDVYSEYAFTTGWESGHEMEVVEGWNSFNGEEALAFCRERHNLADGDNQRGKNQQAVITAMLKKVLSPTMLLKASSIINQVGQGVETNISQPQINAVVKDQLSTGASWTIQSVAAKGIDATDYPYSASSTEVYVMYPDQSSVDEIISLINTVENGGMLESGEQLN